MVSISQRMGQGAGRPRTRSRDCPQAGVLRTQAPTPGDSLPAPFPSPTPTWNAAGFDPSTMRSKQKTAHRVAGGGELLCS